MCKLLGTSTNLFKFGRRPSFFCKTRRPLIRRDELLKSLRLEYQSDELRRGKMVCSKSSIHGGCAKTDIFLLRTSKGFGFESRFFSFLKPTCWWLKISRWLADLVHIYIYIALVTWTLLLLLVFALPVTFFQRNPSNYIIYIARPHDICW